MPDLGDGRDVGVVATVLVAGWEKAAAHRLAAALDGQAPPGERTVQAGGDGGGAARVDPGSAGAGAESMARTDEWRTA